MNEQVTMMNQQQQQQPLMNTNPSLMNVNQMNPHQHQPQMVPISRNHGMWPPPPQFPNPNPNSGSIEPPEYIGFGKLAGPRTNWKGEKVNRPNGKKRKEQHTSFTFGSSSGGTNTISGGNGNPNFNSYQPPTLNELQHQNRLKTRKKFPRKKFNQNKNINMNMNMNTRGNFSKNNSWSAPFAPRNTTSFLIRAKKSGGIASLVSPYPVTPAVLPTPKFSPSREVLVDMAKAEWGVDGYGSMKGLIRLRSPGFVMEVPEDDDEDEGESSDSDVEEHVEVERRLDHDLSRFEMIYNPNSVEVGGMEYHNVLENRVDDQDSHIAQLEEENLILKQRMFLMESELSDLRRMMQFLERRANRGDVVENVSEDDSEGRGEEARSMEDNDEDYGEDNVQGDECFKGKGDDGNNAEGFEAAATKEEEVSLVVEQKVENSDNLLVEGNNHGELIEVHRTEENNEFVENIVGESIDENKAPDAEAKVEDDVVVQSPEHVMVEGDVSMEEAGVVKNDKVSVISMEEAGVVKSDKVSEK